MNLTMKKTTRAIVISLGVFQMENNFGVRQEIFTDYETKTLENENLECFVEALDEMGKNPDVLDYSSHVARIMTTNGYGKEQVYSFDYLDNQILSFQNRKFLNRGIKRAQSNDSSDSYTYDEDGRLLSVKRPNAEYSMQYDDMGNLLNEKVNDRAIKSYEYNDDSKLTESEFANGYHSDYSYDESKNLIHVSDNEKNAFNYIYKDGRMVGYNEEKLPFSSSFTYDSKGMLIRSIDSNRLMKSFSYDEEGNSSHKSFSYQGLETVTDDNGNNGFFTLGTKKDISDRTRYLYLADKEGFKYTQEYQYLVSEPFDEELDETNYDDSYDNATDDIRISSSSNPWLSVSYTYDEEGNVHTYADDSGKEFYSYDGDGQLLSYIDYRGTQHTLRYDGFGNILEKDGVSYFYDTSTGFDELIRYGSESFQYDANGNPISYRGKSMQWEGKRLADIYGVAHFFYNGAGIRTVKETSHGLTRYILDGTKVIFEKTDDKQPIQFLYASPSSKDLIGLVYKGHRFYYVKDARKDILGIVDLSGKLVVRYQYDPWGKILSITGELADTLGKDNPYRYRSYRYDNETGFYYLDSRYYDPEIGRFLSPDSLTNLQYTVMEGDYAKNLYCYCNNSPVSRVDPSGNMSEKWLTDFWKRYCIEKRISDDDIGLTCVAHNGLGFFTAFHETAQLVAAKELTDELYATSLEYHIGRKSADIFAKKGISYLYEVKSFGLSYNKAKEQLQGYLNSTHFLVGPAFQPQSINFVRNIYMDVYYQEGGIVWYEFHSKKRRYQNVEVVAVVKEEDIQKKLRRKYWIGKAVVAAIILATLAEDVLTSGAGVADDAASLATALFCYKAIMAFGF